MDSSCQMLDCRALFKFTLINCYHMQWPISKGNVPGTMGLGVVSQGSTAQ